MHLTNVLFFTLTAVWNIACNIYFYRLIGTKVFRRIESAKRSKLIRTVIDSIIHGAIIMANKTIMKPITNQAKRKDIILVIYY
jgi:uncharacterized membrane protein